MTHARQDRGLEEETEEDMSATARSKRYYRLSEPVLPVRGTTAPFYRSLLTAPTDAPRSQAVLPVLSPVLPVMYVPARTCWATAHVSPFTYLFA